MIRRILLISLTLTALSLTAMPSQAAKMRLRVDISPVPPALSARVSLSEPSGNRILDAGEKGTLSITVNNAGPGEAYGVSVAMAPVSEVPGLMLPGPIDFGDVPPGRSVTREAEVSATEALPSAKAIVKLTVTEAGGFDADPVRIAFDTRQFEPPKLALVGMAIDDQNGNSMIEPMENVEMKVRVQNLGQGEARDVSVQVLPGADVFIGGSGSSLFSIGNLPPSQHADVSFMFYTNKRIRDGERIPLSIRMNESRDMYSAVQALDLTMNARQKGIKEYVVRGAEAPRVPVQRSAGSASADIDANIPSTSLENRDAIAVVIGNRDYQNAKPVEYAINDAQSVKNYLMKVFGYREANIFFMTNASKGDFERFFGVKGVHKGKLFNAVKPNRSDVFVYYSGHGAPGLKDKKGYFVPTEADPQYLNLEGYSADVFFENLSKLPARNLTVVIDACFSGASVFEGISPMVVEIENPISLKKGVVLTSSTGSQVSSWYHEKRHGMFTYYFLKAIHGRNADRDRNGDLTFEEIFNYVSDRSDGVPYQARRLHGVEQDPTIQGGYKDRILLRY